MSDRTYLTFRAHHVPKHKIELFSQLLGQCFPDQDPDHWDPDDARPVPPGSAPNPEHAEGSFADALRRGVTDFQVEEAPCGTVESADVAALTEAVPDAEWEFWEDPKYEWLGSWVGYHPDCGLVGPLECDSYGNQQVSYQEAETRINTWTSEQPDAAELTADQFLVVLFPQRALHRLLRGATARERPGTVTAVDRTPPQTPLHIARISSGHIGTPSGTQ